MRKTLQLGAALAMTAIAVFAGVSSAQARPAFSATPTIGGTETVVTVSDTSSDMYLNEAGVVCSLDGQQDQHFLVAVDGADPRTGTVNIVAMPAAGPWNCNVYSYLGSPVSPVGSFNYTYTGELSVSAVDCPPAPAPDPELASTGTSTTSIALPVAVAALFLVGGIVTVAIVRTRRRKTAVFAIPLLLLALGGVGFASQPVQSAQADVPTGATAAGMPWIGVESVDGLNITASITSLAQWVNIADGCGTLSYQWQGTTDSGATWQPVGEPTSSPTPFTFDIGVWTDGARLQVTLITASGSTVVTSNWLHPVG